MNESFELMYSSYNERNGVPGEHSHSPDKLRSKKLVNHGAAMRSQDFIDGPNASSEYHQIPDDKSNMRSCTKPVNIGLKTMRRTS